MTTPESDAVTAVPLSARRVGGGISERCAVGLAASAWVGATAVTVVSVVGLAFVVVVATVSRRFAMCALVLLLCGTLADRSLDGLRAPLPDRVDGRVELVSDPEWFGGAVRVDIRHDGRRYESWSRGAPARVVARMASGESFLATGDVSAFDDDWPPRLARHVAGVVEIEQASGVEEASGLTGLANRFRALVTTGASPLSHRDRVLLTGFTVGDDRDQLPEVTDDFRAAGLTHLTAVSGQNVAFVLLLFSPLLARLRPLAGFLVVVVVLVQFGLITRWEPSVMRAVAMAIAAGWEMHRPGARSGLRSLALVVTVLLVIDPLLVHSVGFRLSVLASVGIVLFSTRLRAVLPGPAVVRDPLALTIAAQAAVAPLLVTTFGSMPLVSIPANVLAGPVAGPLMAHGLVAGPAAGLVGGPVASLLHLPTRVMTGYLAAIAHLARDAGLPDLGLAGLVVLVVFGCSALVIRGRTGVLIVAVGCVAAALVSGPQSFVVPGAQLFSSDDEAVLVIDRPSPERLLEGVRRARVTDVELVVLRSSSARTAAAHRALVSRVNVVDGVGPTGSPAGVGVVERTTTIPLDSLTVELDVVGDRLVVRVDER